MRRVTQACLILLFLNFAPAVFAQAPQSLPSPTEPIRIRVDRVDVGVTVTDSRGHFISGLPRDDFQVFDNGVQQPITDFLPIEGPAELVLLIESGPAVLFLGKSHLRAADALLSSVSPSDRIAIADYSNAPELLLDFTTDKEQARLALGGMNFMVGFGDLNLSFSLAATLDWLSSITGKKTIVLLSSGVDTSPRETWQRVQRALQISDVRILAVSLAGDFRKPAKVKKLSPQARSDRAFVKEVFAEADQQLSAISAATGGRVYLPRNTKEFDCAYSEISQLVRHEYRVAFAPPVLDGRTHLIDVRVKHSSYRVDHRQAYLAPAQH